MTLLVKPQDIVLYEPYMELFLECPVEFAGKVTDDIQARGGRGPGSERGRTHAFFEGGSPAAALFRLFHGCPLGIEGPLNISSAF